jgi:hypothetical protein
MLRLHGVFLAILAVTLVHDLLAGSREDRGSRRPFEQFLVLPLLFGLAAVLVWDRMAPHEASLLTRPWVAHLFPLAYLLAVVQNTVTILRRGARLMDIPLVLFNVGMGAVVLLADLALLGSHLGFREDTLLYEGAVVQGLLGTRLSHVWTLSWHLPFLLRRGTTRTLGSIAAGLLPAAVATLAVVLLVALHDTAAGVVSAFELEPTLERLPADLAVGVTTRIDKEPEGPPPATSVAAWRLPADHDGLDLPARPDGRMLVLELAFPYGWHREPPDPATRDQVLVEGAARLAAALQPEILLPLPEPDGEGTLHFGPGTSPEAWRALMETVRAELAAVSPGTRLGLRLAGTGPASADIALALLAPPAVVDVVGPRLEPGGHARGQGAHADAALLAWDDWLDGVEDPPELWILAAGCSPLAFGERAQARFVEGCLARAAARPEVVGVLLSGWRDLGHTTGLLHADGRPRVAGRRLGELLAAPRDAERR